MTFLIIENYGLKVIESIDLRNWGIAWSLLTEPTGGLLGRPMCNWGRLRVIYDDDGDSSNKSVFYPTLRLYFVLDDSPIFMNNAARLSEESNLHSEFDLQLTRDCGDDLICKPWLVMTLKALDRWAGDKSQRCISQSRPKSCRKRQVHCGI